MSSRTESIVDSIHEKVETKHLDRLKQSAIGDLNSTAFTGRFTAQTMVVALNEFARKMKKELKP